MSVTRFNFFNIPLQIKKEKLPIKGQLKLLLPFAPTLKRLRKRLGMHVNYF